MPKNPQLPAVMTIPTAHTRNPCAVSRKCTSSVCTLAHFVRSRPAKYPPKADAMTWVRINHTIGPLPTAEADAPQFDHGDTAENPKPVPNASRISASEAETNASNHCRPRHAGRVCFIPGRNLSQRGLTVGDRARNCGFIHSLIFARPPNLHLYVITQRSQNRS